MKRHLLTLITVVMCMFLFVICASAETYTVSSNDEYATAYESAVGGDTIIINSKITCDIYANKSITYVLKADWESSKLIVNQPNVEVSFIADGGDYKIMPTNYSTTDGWLNITTAHENVVINLGGMNGGTLTIDGSNATHDRVTYAPESAITLNLLSGSAIANFNTTTTDSDAKASILYAKTVNMYDGCQIYGNKINGAPLIKSNDFNLYGGEIFGNLLTSTRYDISGVGAIYAYHYFTMYGGKLYGNIFNAKNGPSGFNVVGFISVSYGYYGGKMFVYGGEIGDNYATGTGNNEISAMFGIYKNDNSAGDFYYNRAVKGTRYVFTDTPVLSLDEKTGKTIWQVSSYSSSSSNWTGFSWKQTKYYGDKGAIFLKAQKKTIAGNNFDTYTVINAYIYGGTSGATGTARDYAYSGSATIAIPSGYTLWSTDGNKYCHTGRAYTLDEVKATQMITLYSAYDAERETIDGITRCSDCKTRYTCNDPTHDLETLTIFYTNYAEKGVKVLKCNTCGLEKACEVDADPMFNCLGYSVGPDGYSLKAGFKIDVNAMNEFKKFHPDFSFGVVIANANTIASSEVFFADGSLNSNAKGIMISINSVKYATLNADISGFTANNAGSLELVVGIYANDGEGNINLAQYVDAKNYTTTKSYKDMSLNAISFNQVRVAHDMEVLVPQPAPTGDDE